MSQLECHKNVNFSDQYIALANSIKSSAILCQTKMGDFAASPGSEAKKLNGEKVKSDSTLKRIGMVEEALTKGVADSGFHSCKGHED